MTDLHEMAANLRALHASLDGLPDFDRRAFELWRFDGCTIPEIAHGLECTQDEVKQALVRARHHIKRVEETEALT